MAWWEQLETIMANSVVTSEKEAPLKHLQLSRGQSTPHVSAADVVILQ